MKKLILILAIALIASPAFALTVSLNYEGGTSNIVDVIYSGADAANPPRAFALDVQIQSGVANVSAVTDYQQGESTSTNPRFGIYPARIDVNSGGVVANWGTPLADTTTPDPGAGSALPSQHFVLEFASLYYGDANAPVTTGNTSGTLCKFTLAPGAQTAAYNIKMSAETTYRGGVVLEDGTQFTMADSIITIPAAGGPPPKAVIGAPANGASVNRTTDLSWTAGSGGDPATSRDVYFGTVSPGTLIGNQTALTYDTGTMTQGKTYYWRIDEKNSFGTTTGDVWSFNTNCLKQSGVTTAVWNDWVAWGKPSCWCYQRQCRGDLNGVKTGQWVSLTDLNNFKSAYIKNDTQLSLIANGICADLNHVKTGQRVSLTDLNQFKSYYIKPDTQVPVCDVATVNFWMN